MVYGIVYELVKLKNFYNRTYDVVYYNISDSYFTFVYENHDFATIDDVVDLVQPAMNQAYENWAREYMDLRDCVYKRLKNDSKKYVTGAAMFFCSSFFVLLFCRRIVMQLVKKEYTASEWKTESYNNKLYLCLLTFVSLLFLAYLFWIRDHRAEYLRGVFGRHWIF